MDINVAQEEVTSLRKDLSESPHCPLLCAHSLQATMSLKYPFSN